MAASAPDGYYAGRFAPPVYLVPFYRGERSDVVAVYESSECYQGYFAQARERLLAETAGFTHVAFVADDLLLNPRLDSASFAAALQLTPTTGYAKRLTTLDQVSPTWPHLRRSLQAFDTADRQRFVEFRGALPDASDAAARLARHGLRCGLSTWRSSVDPSLWRPQRHWAALRSIVRDGLRQRLPFPLVMGYSDLLVVPRIALTEFTHLCGVFAAIRLFVETAAPTALALSCEIVRTEREVTPWRGQELWTQPEVAALERELGLDARRLFDGPRRELLYVHPIKLSRWRV